MSSSELPYRPCIGVMLLDQGGRAFIGQRRNGPEHVDAAHSWQMPQGGIDPGERPYQSALRELFEETNVRSVELLAESSRWYSYDLPADVIGQVWGGRYRGQTQKWFALRFVGSDDEIDVANPGGGHAPEFAAWRWEQIENLPELVIPFKRHVYERVIAEFGHLARP
jgi:putative (di)nucleoside polyphosphate hydrolase